MLNKDYKEILQCLAAEKVKFLLVGAYALAAHGYPRATLDIDLWVMPSPENAEAVLRALRRFGVSVDNLTTAELQEETVFRISCSSGHIHIMAGASRKEFEDAWTESVVVDVEGINVHVPTVETLDQAKTKPKGTEAYRSYSSP